MHKALDIIGLPVIHSVTGAELGRVKDILFNPQWQYEGLLVEANNWLKKGKYVPAPNVSSLGTDAVMVDDDHLHTLERSSHLFGLMTGTPKIKGIPVLTENGNQLGQIEDVYFMENLGILVGYELSDGLFSDLTEGRKMLKKPREVTLGEDALIVPVISEEYVVDNVQGVSMNDTLS